MMSQLKRSKQHKIIFGVCGGLAPHFNISENLLRFIFAVLGLFWLYLILAAIMPIDDVEYLG